MNPVQPVIALWAHPRSLSTAFVRMMMERGDLQVVHEPLVTLVDDGEVELPADDGATVTVRTVDGVLTHLRGLAHERPVFVKNTLEYRYDALFDRPELLAGIRHTFIVRHPDRTISSHHAVKPTVTCPEIGYENQYDLIELVSRHSAHPPVVIEAEWLLASPADAVAAYCAAVGLPFLSAALHWEPQDRAEWQRTREWHIDAIASSSFAAPQRRYELTVSNDPRLRSFYEYHLPFYERILRYAVRP